MCPNCHAGSLGFLRGAIDDFFGRNTRVANTCGAVVVPMCMSVTPAAGNASAGMSCGVIGVTQRWRFNCANGMGSGSVVGMALSLVWKQAPFQ